MYVDAASAFLPLNESRRLEAMQVIQIVRNVTPVQQATLQVARDLLGDRAGAVIGTPEDRLAATAAMERAHEILGSTLDDEVRKRHPNIRELAEEAARQQEQALLAPRAHNIQQNTRASTGRTISHKTSDAELGRLERDRTDRYAQRAADERAADPWQHPPLPPSSRNYGAALAIGAQVREYLDTTPRFTLSGFRLPNDKEIVEGPVLFGNGTWYGQVDKDNRVVLHLVKPFRDLKIEPICKESVTTRMGIGPGGPTIVPNQARSTDLGRAKEHRETAKERSKRIAENREAIRHVLESAHREATARAFARMAERNIPADRLSLQTPELIPVRPGMLYSGEIIGMSKNRHVVAILVMPSEKLHIHLLDSPGLGLSGKQINDLRQGDWLRYGIERQSFTEGGYTKLDTTIVACKQTPAQSRKPRSTPRRLAAPLHSPTAPWATMTKRAIASTRASPSGSKAAWASHQTSPSSKPPFSDSSITAPSSLSTATSHNLSDSRTISIGRASSSTIR